MKALLIAAVLIAAVAFLMFQGRQMSRPGSSGAELTGVTWRLVSIGDEDIPQDSGMRIQFEVDGSIKGHGGCNGFFGALQQTKSGITVGPLGSTRMACPEPIMQREAAFLDAVQSTRGFDTGDESLTLLDEHGEILARFVDAAGDST